MKFNYTIDPETSLSIRNLFKWLLLAILSGIIGTVLVHLFSSIILFSYEMISKHWHLPLFFIPPMGALLVGLVIYRFNKDASSESIPTYIRGMRLNNGRFSLKTTISLFFANVVTLASLNNGGIIDSVSRVTSGIVSKIVEKLNIRTSDSNFDHVRTAAICGFAAAIGAIFGSAIGAAIMAVEIIEKKRMGYQDLFPAILASSTAVYLSRLLEWNQFFTFGVPAEAMDLKYIWALIVIAVSASILGILYIKTYSLLANLINKTFSQLFPKIILGSFIAGIIVWSINPYLLGTAPNMVLAIINHDYSLLRGQLGLSHSLAIVAFILLITKAFGNLISLSSGLNVGIVGPVSIMGLLLGTFWSLILGIPTDSGTYFAFVAAGFCGLLTSILNVPLAAAIIAIELFGLEYSLPVAFVTVISFQLTRSYTIYDVIEKDLLTRGLWKSDL